ncbi:hypothetical protein Hdeb2414_s0048g00749731 [Helianthus debilis subsp. tardiflorus]
MRQLLPESFFTDRQRWCGGGLPIGKRGLPKGLSNPPHRPLKQIFFYPFDYLEAKHNRTDEPTHSW